MGVLTDGLTGSLKILQRPSKFEDIKISPSRVVKHEKTIRPKLNLADDDFRGLLISEAFVTSYDSVR